MCTPAASTRSTVADFQQLLTCKRATEIKNALVEKSLQIRFNQKLFSKDRSKNSTRQLTAARHSLLPEKLLTSTKLRKYFIRTLVKTVCRIRTPISTERFQ